MDDGVADVQRGSVVLAVVKKRATMLRRWIRVRWADLVVLATFLAVVWLIVGNTNDRVAELAVQNCHDVELDKAEDRAAAWRSFNQLKRSLRVLRIPYKTTADGKLDLSDPATKELHDLAVESRDRKLAENQAKPC